MNDVKNAHFFFTKAVEGQLEILPQLLKDEIIQLDTYYDILDSTYKVRLGIGVQKSTNSVQTDEWSERVAILLSRTKWHLRAVTTPENVRMYFQETLGTACRKIDRLNAVIKVLTVSEHFGHAHLGAFRVELETLRAEGETIIGASSVSVTDQKTEVEKVKILKAKWETQYQRLRYLLRGYFHGTSTDYTKFFDEKRIARATRNDAGTAISASDAPSSNAAA
jgi:hypothetical protein